jgi:hypothetical protein
VPAAIQAKPLFIDAAGYTPPVDRRFNIMTSLARAVRLEIRTNGYTPPVDPRALFPFEISQLIKVLAKLGSL